MNNTVLSSLPALFLFVGIVALLEIGRITGQRWLAKDPDSSKARGFSAIEGALYALLGLLIAFTFSGAEQRFDARRHLIIDEANDIGTAYLRLDLLSPSSQPELKSLFRTYVQKRLETYRNVYDYEAVIKGLRETKQIQGEIWTKALAGCPQGSPCTILLLPSLNGMFDIAATRYWVTKFHPPKIVFIMLFGLGLICAFLAGIAMAGSKGHNWIYSVGFALVLAGTIYVILDMEYPRTGLIRVTNMDRALEQVLLDMN
jgi:hypothetical protein